MASNTFGDKDLEGVAVPHNDNLVVTFNITGLDVKIVMINMGRSANLLYMMPLS